MKTTLFRHMRLCALALLTTRKAFRTIKIFGEEKRIARRWHVYYKYCLQRTSKRLTMQTVGVCVVVLDYTFVPQPMHLGTRLTRRGGVSRRNPFAVWTMYVCLSVPTTQLRR